MNFAQQQRKPGNHLIGIGLVILLHILIVYGLMNGLARKMVEVIKNPLEAKIIEEFKPPPPPPEKAAPPPPKAPPPEYVPPVEMPALANAPSVANAITAVTTTVPPPVQAPVPPPAPRAPMRVAAVIDSAVNCKKPIYPAASAREEEQGTVVLGFLIGKDGKVIQSQVQASSGFTRLDEAARNALSLCTFKPGSLDGIPEESRASMKYTWKLE